MKITWRIGQDGKQHAIVDCDEMAAAWGALCGRLITGPEPETGTIHCRVCAKESLYLLK